MTDQRTRFGHDYAAALAASRGAGGASIASVARELGERALRDGESIADIASLHHALLGEVGATRETPRATEPAHAALSFLRDVLSPFDSAIRDGQNARETLSRLEAVGARQRDEVANREIGSFVRSVAHDLRAPLRAIDGFGQAILEDYGEALEGQAREFLEHIQAGARQMAQLIDDLAALSSVMSREMRTGRVDLSAIAGGVAATLRETAPGRRVEFVIEDGLVVDGDPHLLALLVENLLGNAWKFTSKKDRASIELRAMREGPDPVYFVRDNGAGFDPRHAEKLFGPFQRLHSSREFDGTGMGLATVRRIVLRHGGRVWAEGNVGQGATVSFALGAG
jgi:signal transduction histidine kinase